MGLRGKAKPSTTPAPCVSGRFVQRWPSGDELGDLNLRQMQRPFQVRNLNTAEAWHSLTMVLPASPFMRHRVIAGSATPVWWAQ